MLGSHGHHGGTDLIKHVPVELWQAKLGLSLLRQRAKGANSQFAPYIELLPSVHQGVPIFFDGSLIPPEIFFGTIVSWL